MDSEIIKQLLEKYWNCQTTVDEERQLCQYFTSDNVAPELSHVAELFRYFNEEKSKKSDVNFAMKVTKRFQKPEVARTTSLTTIKSVFRIAAGIFVLVVATILIRNEIQKTYPKEIIDTYVDPKLAFEETKKALFLIAESFGKAKNEASKIIMFEKAEETVKDNIVKKN